MTYCKYCDKTFFSIDVLRRDIYNKSVIQTFHTFKYCPFCGKKLEEVEVKPNGIYVD